MAHDDPYSGRTVYADWAYDLSRAASYTPELTASTNPNLGADGTATGWYHRNGHKIDGGARFLFSGAGVSAGSGTYGISLPIAADVSNMQAGSSAGSEDILGSGFIRDDGTTTNSAIVLPVLRSSTTIWLRQHGSVTAVSSSSPFTWATGDRIIIHFTYLAVPSAL